MPRHRTYRYTGPTRLTLEKALAIELASDAARAANEAERQAAVARTDWDAVRRLQEANHQRWLADAPRRKAAREALQKLWRQTGENSMREKHKRRYEELREAKAQGLACLIECLEDMRDAWLA